MKKWNQAHLRENKGSYEAPIHQSITQQNMHYVFQFGLYSIFATDIVESLTTSS